MRRRKRDEFHGLVIDKSPREQDAVEIVSRLSPREFESFRLWVASHVNGAPGRLATFASALFACFAVAFSILLAMPSPLDPLLGLVAALAAGVAAVALMVDFVQEGTPRRHRHFAQWQTVIEIERDRRDVPAVCVEVNVCRHLD